MGSRPAVKISVGLGVPKGVFGKAQQNAVDDQAAVLIARQPVAAAPDLDFRNVLGEELVEQALGVGTFELKRPFACVKHGGFLAQEPIAILRRMVIKAARHVPAIIDAVVRPLGPLDLVIGMARLRIVPAGAGHARYQITGLAVTRSHRTPLCVGLSNEIVAGVHAGGSKAQGYSSLPVRVNAGPRYSA